MGQDSTNGVFIDGIPLNAWLKEQEDENKTKEANKDRIKKEHMSLYKKPIKTTHQIKEKNGKVRHLTTKEIIKEYGMKPYKDMTNTEKLLYTMLCNLDARELSAKDIIQRAQLNCKHDSATGLFSTIWKALGNDIFVRRRVTGNGKPHYLYCKNKPYSTANLLQLYEKVKADQCKTERDRKKSKNLDAQKTEALTFDGTTPSQTDEHHEIQFEQIDEAVDKNVNINVNLNFRINISLGFSRE